MTRRVPDVLIVGAGASGLAAAVKLVEAGAHVVVLEARATPGGRIRTVRPRGFPLPIELGAEFLHGRPELSFRVAREETLLVDRLSDVHRVARGRRLEALPDFWQIADRITRRMRSSGRDRSATDFLASHRAMPSREKQLLVSLIEGYHAAPVGDVSEHSLSTAGEPRPGPDTTDQFRILSGYDAIIAALLRRARRAGARIRFRAPVREIRWARGSVLAIGADGRRWRARRAVVTVPLGVLASPPRGRGTIWFEPEVPAIRSAVEKLGVGHVVRLVLRFRTPFWDDAAERGRIGVDGDEPLSFLQTPGRSFTAWWTAAPADLPLLTAWAGGPPVRGWRTDVESLCSRALADLSAVFRTPRRRLRALLVRGWTHDWNADPFARGAYSYVRVGGGGAREALARPVAGTLYFAGEATDPERSGTVEGALASGERVAAQLLRVRG